MSLERFCVKFLATPDSQVDEESLIPIFHEWIRLHTLKGTLIDVADYRHVPNGPGMMLITHEINYAMEHGGGQYGLSAQRKLGYESSQTEKILSLVKSAANFGALLESDRRVSGNINFQGNQFVFIANDRLNAPNTEETFNQLKPELEAVAAQLYPNQKITVSRVNNDARARLSVLIQAENAVKIADLAN